MAPGVRRLALTVHVASSVGWFGAVVVFLVLAAVGATSEDPRMVAAVLVAMEPITWWALVPFAFASLLSGIVSSLGTAWGLFGHYWVLFKLVLNLIATVVLVLYTRTIGLIAGAAADPTASGADLRALAASPLLHAGAALLVLLAATVLAVYKPRGRTRYGQRRQHERRARPEHAAAPVR
jgi:hypothetical protein